MIRARILKRVRVEASEVQEALEEVRWKFHDLSQGEKSINEAGQTQSYVTKTNKSRTRTESRGNYQEKECAETGATKRDPRKEEEKVYKGAQEGHHTKARENSRGKTEGTRVLGAEDSFIEEFPENRNRVTGGAEFKGGHYSLERPTPSRNTDSIESDQGKSAGAQGPENGRPGAGRCESRRVKDLNDRVTTNIK